MNSIHLFLSLLLKWRKFLKNTILVSKGLRHSVSKTQRHDVLDKGLLFVVVKCEWNMLQFSGLAATTTWPMTTAGSPSTTATAGGRASRTAPWERGSMASRPRPTTGPTGSPWASSRCTSSVAEVGISRSMDLGHLLEIMCDTFEILRHVPGEVFSVCGNYYILVQMHHN